MQVKKDAVQKAIIKAATDEFLKYGYAGASMRRMAKAAGTGLGNFYNYFSSKDEIFAYIVSDQYAKTQAYIALSLIHIFNEACGYTEKKKTDEKS